YLFIRAFGGFLYAIGSLTLTFVVIKSIWPKIQVIFQSEGRLSVINCDDLHRMHRLVGDLLQEEKKIEPLLKRIQVLYQRLLFLNKEK
ncbi:MAG: Nitric-oxide reductase, partial [Firmicutes bacterium]|nr:Nitric-oxide reductase [Bacillota bacterium]